MFRSLFTKARVLPKVTNTRSFTGTPGIFNRVVDHSQAESPQPNTFDFLKFQADLKKHEVIRPGSKLTPDANQRTFLHNIQKEVPNVGDFVSSNEGGAKKFSPVGPHDYATTCYIGDLPKGMDLSSPAMSRLIMRVWSAAFPGSSVGVRKMARKENDFSAAPEDDGRYGAGDFLQLNPEGDIIFVDSVQLGQTELCMHVKTSVYHKITGSVAKMFRYNPLTGAFYHVEVGTGGGELSPGPIINSTVAIEMWRLHGKKLQVAFRHVMQNEKLREKLLSDLSSEEWAKLQSAFAETINSDPKISELWFKILLTFGKPANNLSKAWHGSGANGTGVK